MKVWKVKNSGATAWPPGTRLVYLSGEVEPVDGPKSQINVSAAEAGESVDVAVRIVTPKQTGRFFGYYRLSDANGQTFGDRLWVLVNVVEARVAGDRSFVDEKSHSDAPATMVDVPAPVVEAPKVVVPAPAVVAPAPAPAPAVEAPKPSAPPAQPAQPPKQPSALEIKFAMQLHALEGMGFTDRKRNIELLQTHKGDVNNVVNAYLG